MELCSCWELGKLYLQPHRITGEFREAQLFNCRVFTINLCFDIGNYGNQIKQGFTQILEQARAATISIQKGGSCGIKNFKFCTKFHSKLGCDPNISNRAISVISLQ